MAKIVPQDRHARKGHEMMAISALDCALWDLRAKRNGIPHWRELGASSGRVAAYASGLDGAAAAALDPLRDHVAAVSCGVHNGVAVLDLDYAEDSAAETDANFVITGSGGLVEVQGTAEGAVFDRKTLDALLDLAVAGCGELTRLQEEALSSPAAHR